MNRRPHGFQDYIAAQGFYAVYLVTTVWDAPIKVGIAQDTVRRLAGLQNANFEQLRIHRFWWLAGRPIAARVEKSFKKHFALAAIRGEWFDVSLGTAEAFIEGAIQSVGTWTLGQEDMVKFMQEWERRCGDRLFERISPGNQLARALQVSWPVSRLLR